MWKPIERMCQAQLRTIVEDMEAGRTHVGRGLMAGATRGYETMELDANVRHTRQAKDVRSLFC